MWSLLALLLLPGCSTPDPVAPETPTAGPGKAKGPGKSKKGKGKTKGKAKLAPPIGVAGPVSGELTLKVVEEAPPAAPVPPVPAEPAPGAPPATPAPGTPAPGAPPVPVDGEPPATPPATPAPVVPVKKTQADLLLTFSDGQSAPVNLGKVNGTCVDAPVVPIGPEGAQQTPLWNVECVDAATTTNLAILQAGDVITVFRAAPAPDGTVAYKPVKRVRLASGATLTRKSG